MGWVNTHPSDPIQGDFPPAVAYSSSDGVTWRCVASISTASPFSSVAFAGGRWIAAGINLHQGDIPSSTYVSTNGTTWTQQRDAGLNHSVSDGLIAFGGGRWALAGLDISPGHTSGPEGGVVALSSDAINWTLPPGGHFAGNQVFGIANGNGEWLVSGGRGDILSSPNGKAWAKRGHLAGAAALAFGGSTPTNGTTPAPTITPTPRPASTTTATTAATSTTAPATMTTTTTVKANSMLERIHWDNFTYQDFACATQRPVKLTDKTWIKPGTKGQFDECSMTFTGVNYADVTGDGVTDAIVSLHGSASPFRAGQSDVTIVFTVGPAGPVSHGYIYGPSFPPYSAVRRDHHLDPAPRWYRTLVLSESVREGSLCVFDRDRQVRQGGHDLRPLR